MGQFKCGDRVIKARPYNATKYCRHGGDSSIVPIGTEGIVTNLPSSSDSIYVQFDNGTNWSVDENELDLSRNMEILKDTEIQIGDMVEVINHRCDQIRNVGKVTDIDIKGCIQTNLCPNHHAKDTFRLIKKLEENKMVDIELDKVKTTNLKEAKKQFDSERMNAEVEFAKRKLKEATDQVDYFDRQIKGLEEQKKPYLETIKKFA